MTALIDIIYNMTQVCPHDCEGCCVDAAHVTRRGNIAEMRTKSLTHEEFIPIEDRSVSVFDIASRALQKSGREMTYDQKMQVIQNLDIAGVRLDISGGDPLCVTENIDVLRKATEKLGRDNVTLTATGTGMAGVDLDELVQLVGEFNFTYDSASNDDVSGRPQTYASRNLYVGRALKKLGAKTRAEFPIMRSTSMSEHVERLYMNLHDAGIDKLLLMRLFAVGRGKQLEHETLTPDEYRTVIKQLRDLERQHGFPKLKLQCALRHIEPAPAGAAKSTVNPCDLVRESFGLTSRGILLSSPWAIDKHGEPMDDIFVLGNLATTKLSEILASDRVSEIRARSDQNFGHCKIFAYQQSRLSAPLDRLFDTADPLYANVEQNKDAGTIFAAE